MLVDTEVKDAVQSLEEVSPEAEAPAAETEMVAEGEVPQVATDANAAEAQTASEQAFSPTQGVGVAPEKGMFYPAEYQAACESAGTPEKWNPAYAAGHTEAKGWTQPHEGRVDHAFELKHGHSASQAVKDFLHGPTITDFRTMGVAVEMDALRDSLGDVEFDRLFGSRDSERDHQIPKAQRLKITSEMYTIPFVDQMMAMADAEVDLNKPQAEEPAAPAVEARVEEQTAEAGMSGPAPEQIADELGMDRRQQEFA